jgi:hypothetical protein
MRLVLLGAAIMLGGLALLMAMVVRVIEPGLGLSLFAYATAMTGMVVGLAGAVRHAADRRAQRASAGEDFTVDDRHR